VWIGDGGDKPIYVRKSLALGSKKISRAFVFASGLGHFNLFVNGQAASAHVLDPGWTNYHRTVQFVGYDVTEHLLSDGTKNVVGAHIGNGFYAGDKGGDGRFFWPMYEDNTYVRYGNELCFFAEIHVHYCDGSHECIITDPSWSVRKSATTLANIYASEDHDRRVYPLGWSAPGFNETTDSQAWKPAKPLTGPRGKLRYQSQPPVVLHNTFQPVSQKEVRPGVVVYDLGQNSSIMVRVEASGPAGSSYRVRYSETLGEDGLVLMPDPLFKEFETGVFSTVTLAGTGSASNTEVWTPDFSFTSARYIQVEASADNTPTIHSVSARHCSSGAPVLGFVRTDKDDINSLINACYWTFSSNLLSYHTDCPQIEKFGWLEVTSLLFPATQYIRDIESLHSKILDDIVDTQEPSGLVPTMAPLVRYMCGPMHDTITWGGAICLLPELIREYYDSTAVFARMYKPCVAYMGYMLTRERRGGIIEHGLGDWGRDIAYGNHQANIETAVYYKCLRNVQNMAEQLGLPEDAARFRAWAERIYRVYNEQLLVLPTGSSSSSSNEYTYAFYTSLDEPGVLDRTMVAQAVALQFGLVPPAHRADVITAFVADCEAQGRVMRAGEIGLKYLLNTLADDDVDRPDILLDMVRQEDHPSYMRFLRRGETTLLEFWQDECRSKCHDMLGTVYEWFYSYLLGVRSLEPAYRRWRLRPCFAAREFGSVEGEIQCPYGLIAVSFTRYSGEGAQDRASVRVSVPVGTTCDLILPSDGSVVEVRREGDSEAPLVIRSKTAELLPGSYVLEITA